MSRKLGGSKLTKPYNRQWLTKNPVELLCRLFKCTPSVQINVTIIPENIRFILVHAQFTYLNHDPHGAEKNPIQIGV